MTLTTTLTPTLPSGPIRVAIVASGYNAWITDRLRDGAVSELHRRVPDRAQATVIAVPGAFEIPTAAAAAARSGQYHAVVALGCIIKGETIHDEVIANAVAASLVEAGAATGVPVTMGVLTVNTAQQAEARAGGPQGNKGAEAMSAAIDLLSTLHALHLHRHT
ncbi:MAG: 6,7-dimethyl-8-ribityllumazine synthase [Planctomycetes bacterium]|nr:6,7-dimethyl-8-ribityllumazine synthase [Planctomycetota bacterium]